MSRTVLWLALYAGATFSPAMASPAHPDSTDVVHYHRLSDQIEYDWRPLGMRVESDLWTDGRCVRWRSRSWSRSVWFGPQPTAYVLRLADAAVFALYDSPHVYQQLDLDSLRTRWCRWARQVDYELPLPDSSLGHPVRISCDVDTIAQQETLAGSTYLHTRIRVREPHGWISSFGWSPPATGPDTLQRAEWIDLDLWTAPAAGLDPSVEKAIHILAGDSLTACPGLDAVLRDLLGVASSSASLFCAWPMRAAVPAMRTLQGARDVARSLSLGLCGPPPNRSDAARVDTTFARLRSFVIDAYRDSAGWSNGLERTLRAQVLRTFPTTDTPDTVGSGSHWPNLRALGVKGPGVQEFTVRRERVALDAVDIPAWMPAARDGDLWEPCPMRVLKPIVRRSLRV